MSSFHDTGSLSILHNSNDHITALNVEESERYLLLMGPDVLKESIHAPSSLLVLLKQMVSWCIEKKFISQYNTIEDFHAQYDRKPLQETLTRLGYILEECLSEKYQQQECLQTTLEQYTQSVEKYRLLVRKPFRGYVTTTYDTFIETAYEEEWHEPLLKFYLSSIGDAIEAYQKGRPFILKLYGDIDNSASIILGPRFIRELSNIREQRQLRVLLSLSPVLFTGFEEADPDLGSLSSMTTDWPILSPKTKDDLSIEQLEEYPHLNVIHRSILNYVTSPVLPQIHFPLNAAIKDNPDTVRLPPEPRYTLEPQDTKNASAIEIFTVYMPSDEKIKQGIEDILTILQKQRWRLICQWGRATIEAEWKKRDYLKTSHLILLVVSQDFLKTDFCYSDEIKCAIERLKREDICCILPIIGRPVALSLLADTPFGQLPFLPRDGKSVIRRKDSAFAEIATHIKEKLDSWQYY
jgi:SIR2-like domain